MINQSPLVLTPETQGDVARHLPRLMRPMLRMATQLKVGSLEIVLPDGRALLVKGTAPGPEGLVIIHRWRVFRRAALRGDVGFGEAYMDGDWDSPDIAALLGVFAANAAIRGAGGTFSAGPLAGLLLRLGHFLRSNTRAGAKRNIAAHYDLGNHFYEQWLDPTMMYSSALFSQGADDLEAAQIDKCRSLVAQTGISSDHHVLEIGCGWGGFACLAAQETGCRVTGLTLSVEQKAYAEARIRARGLSDQITIELCDYRDVRGSFDRIVSIEMFEAVGERYWPVYFEVLSDLLKPGGTAGLQIITIRDDFFKSYTKSADFLQTYIFPGGILPPVSRLPALAQSVGLEPSSVMTFGPDYARTLALWRDRFEVAWPRIKDQGFDERFRKMWLYYLAICEAGFSAGLVDVQQGLYCKP